MPTYEPATATEVAAVIASIVEDGTVPPGFAFSVQWNPPVRRVVLGDGITSAEPPIAGLVRAVIDEPSTATKATINSAVSSVLSDDGSLAQLSVRDLIIDQLTQAIIDSATDIAEEAIENAVVGLDLVAANPSFDQDIGFVVADQNGRATSLILRRDGNLHDYAVDQWSQRLASAVMSAYGIEAINETVSGYAVVVTNDDGQIAWGIQMDGTGGGAGTGSAASPTLYPDLNWAHWTDSLGGGLATRLAAYTGRDHYDGGVGGQQSSHVAARMGALPPLVTVAGNEIPASGSVTITAIVRPPIRWEVTDTPPGSTLAVSGSLTAADGTVVQGTIQQASGTFSFTRTNPGDAVTLVPKTKFIPTYGAAHINRHQLIIAGRNSMSLADNRRVAQDVVAMLHHHTAVQGRTILCDVPQGASDGSTTVATVTDWNTVWLPRIAPGQYFPLFAKLRTPEAASTAGITFTSQDNADIAAGLTPTSFRADDLHLNALGQDVAAAFLYQEMQTRGWL